MTADATISVTRDLVTRFEGVICDQEMVTLSFFKLLVASFFFFFIEQHGSEIES